MKTTLSNVREMKLKLDIIDSIHRHDLRSQEIIDVLCSVLLDHGVHVEHTKSPTYNLETKFRRKQCDAFHKIYGPLPKRI